MTVTPSAASCIAGSAAPTVVLGSTTATPTASSAIAACVDPTVLEGDIIVTPTAGSCIAASAGPSAVIYGSVSITPSPASCIAGSAAPTVVLGSTTATPSAVSAIAATTGPTVLAIVLRVDFEEGDLSDFDSTTNGEDLAANNASVLVGAYGMQVTCDDTSVHYGYNDLTISTGEVRYRFYLDPNGLTMGSGDDLDVARIQCDGTYNSIDELCSVVLGYFSGSYRIRLNVEPDSGLDQQTTWQNISDNSHYIEVYMKSESSDGAADGIARIYIDGVETAGSITDLENYNVFTTIEGMRFGLAHGQLGTTSGAYYVDDLVVRDDDTEIGPASDDLTYAPGSVSVIASSVNPTVVQSSMTVTPGAGSCIASTVDPSVAVGSISITPSPVSCIVSSSGPVVLEGDLIVTPTAGSCIASTSGPSAVILGSVSITPTPGYAIASTSGPTVALSDVNITPSPVSCIAQVGGLAVDVNGDLYCLPYATVSIASAPDATVWERPKIIVDLTLYARSFSWGELPERSGFFIVYNILFEDGIIMEFEDGDEATWGASRSGFSLPARDLDFSLVDDREE